MLFLLFWGDVWFFVEIYIILFVSFSFSMFWFGLLV